MQTPPIDPESGAHHGDGASGIKAQATRLGEKAAAAIDNQRDTVARGMEAAASSLRDKARVLPGEAKLTRATDTAAAAMESAADYVRDHEVPDMLADVGRIVRKHPGATLLTAVAVGFLLARSLSRK